MNWIDRVKNKIIRKNKRHQGDSQYQLMLLLCIPCYLITAISLFLAQLSGYLIAFILIVLLLLCSYVVIASRYNSAFQIRTLSNLIESLIDGDYTLRGRLQTNQAYQELLNLINNLAETLSKHKIEAKESRLLLERILEQMDAMVFATNEQGYIVMANGSAKKLVFNNQDDIFSLNLACLPLGAEIIEAKSGLVDFSEGQQNQTLLKGEHFLFKESFLSEGKSHQLFMLTNAERLLMEKERKAWQGLLRVLSHELNNSLTPIAAISESMKKKIAQKDNALDRSTLLEGINIINERADSLNDFISQYSQLSHLPKPTKTDFKLTELVENIARLFPECVVEHEISHDIMLTADKNQIEQVLINVFKNASEAMVGTTKKYIQLSYHQDEQWIYFTLRDHGKGIANLDNIFVPFYTTKAQGSGIGLALCRQIMFNHHGLIKLANMVDVESEQSAKSEQAGVEVILSFPQS